MNILLNIFTWYDRFFSQFDPQVQFLVALFFLIFFVLSIFGLLKNGHWVFVIVILVLFPGSIVAVKTLGLLIWLAIKFLLVRLSINV